MTSCNLTRTADASPISTIVADMHITYDMDSMSFTQIFFIMRVAGFNPGSNPYHLRALNSVCPSHSHNTSRRLSNHSLTLLSEASARSLQYEHCQSKGVTFRLSMAPSEVNLVHT
jgi:hypothetical protein